MTIKKSNIEIPAEWLEKIEKQPKSYNIPNEKQNQIKEFVKLKYPEYSVNAISKVCGVSTWTIRKIIEKIWKKVQNNLTFLSKFSILLV